MAPNGAAVFAGGVSLAEQIERLELFENLHRQIHTLNQQVSSLNSSHQQQLDALKTMTDEQLQAQRTKFAMALEAVEVNSARDDDRLNTLQHYADQLAAAGDQLANDKDRLQAELNALQVQLKTSLRTTDNAQQQQRELDAEVKQLRALNPERLAKQVKELQKANKEKTAAATLLRKQCRQLQKENQDKSLTILKLDTALEKACKDFNEKHRIEPLEILDLGNAGVWEIYGHDKVNRYDVLDQKNNVSLGLEVAEGRLIIPEVRTVPAAVTKNIIDRAGRYEKTMAEIARGKQSTTSKEA